MKNVFHVVLLLFLASISYFFWRISENQSAGLERGFARDIRLRTLEKRVEILEKPLVQGVLRANETESKELTE